MKKILVLAVLISCTSFAKIEHTVTIVQRPDGQFDVTCMDGNVEIRTKEDLINNRVCILFNTVEGDWLLKDGGIDNGKKMCDMHITFVRTRDAIYKLSALFKAPCTGTVGETQDCRAMICNLRLDGKGYTMDFSTAGRLNMSRVEDGLQAGYTGDTGKGGPGGVVNLGNTRTIEMNGVPNVLQVTNDNGATWKAICDDSFDDNGATVACRDMGFAAFDSYQTSIDVPGDNDFGLDDVACQGNEANLFECNHTAWNMHNCSSTEHVTLVCKQ